jgi:zinc transporter ZupT
MDIPYERILPSGMAVAVFVLVHLTAPRLYGFSERHKYRVLSFSGGVASAYVFLDLLPLLQGAGYHFTRLFGASLFARIFLEKAVFGVAFLGFLSFFLIEYLAFAARRQAAGAGDIDGVPAGRGIFAVHLGLTMLLSLVISFSLQFEVRTGIVRALLYTVALSLHFFISDHAMEEHYRDLYVRYGRAALACMPPLGWALSFLFPERLSEAYVLLAFIAGAVLFTVVKDEVPKIGRGRPLYFLSGAVIYAALVLLVSRVRI